MSTSAPFARALALVAAAAACAAASPAVAAPPGKPPATPPPVTVHVTAPSPDPAWTIRVDNEGDERVRIAADVRLLSIEIQPKGARAFRRCKPAPGQTPTRFPVARELYLAPGESWVERFDPRLFCFGDEGDLLRGGTVVRMRFGFDPRAGNREPYVAQGTSSPPSFAAARQLVVPTILLSHLPEERTRADALPAGASRANQPLDKVPPPPQPHGPRRPGDPPPPGFGATEGVPPPAPPSPVKDGDPASGEGARREGHGAHHDGKHHEHDHGDPGRRDGEARKRPEDKTAAELEVEKEREREKQREAELRATYGEPAVPSPPPDRMAPDLDLYADRWSSGGNPRDLVLRLRARNEGGRALATVVRSRMLRFRVEGPLSPENQTTGTTECIVDERTHGVPTEMVRNLRPGERAEIPFLLAEVCPRGTFDRPGLFRVTPVLDASIEGEAVDHEDAFRGRIRALQPALARIGSSKLPYYDTAPRAVSTAGLRPSDDEEEESSEGAEPAKPAP